jgi:hypothetical protein
VATIQRIIMATDPATVFRPRPSRRRCWPTVLGSSRRRFASRSFRPPDRRGNTDGTNWRACVDRFYPLPTDHPAHSVIDLRARADNRSADRHRRHEPPFPRPSGHVSVANRMATIGGRCGRRGVTSCRPPGHVHSPNVLHDAGERTVIVRYHLNNGGSSCRRSSHRHTNPS